MKRNEKIIKKVEEFYEILVWTYRVVTFLKCLFVYVFFHWMIYILINLTYEPPSSFDLVVTFPLIFCIEALIIIFLYNFFLNMNNWNMEED